MNRMRYLFSLPLASVVLFGACMDAPMERDTFELQRAIQGGEIDEVDRSVVGLVTGSGWASGICSGSLIAENVVLTAQHCIASLNTQQYVDCNNSVFGPPNNPNTVRVTTNYTIDNGPFYGTREILIPPGDGVCGQDIALLVLSDPIPASDTTPYPVRIDSDLAQGEVYSAAGFGGTSDGGGGSGVRRRRDNLSVSCVGAACGGWDIYNTEWLGDEGICSGDSGGPALDQLGQVVGVVSRGGQNCSTPIYGGTYPWREWLTEQVINATGSAGITPPPWALGEGVDPRFIWPVGGPCTADGDCPSGICLDGLCSRACETDYPCPAGYGCAEGLCVELPVGTACESTTDCFGGACVNGLCTRPCVDSEQLCPPGWRCDYETDLCATIEIGDICSSGADCDGGLCVDGVCSRACSENLPCPDTYNCWNGMCVEPAVGDWCNSDTECLGGICVDGVCEFGCASDADCAEGELCDTSSGECAAADVTAPVTCAADSDCEVGTCQDGQCVECEGDDCQPVTSGENTGAIADPTSSASQNMVSGSGTSGCSAATTQPNLPLIALMAVGLFLGLTRRRNSPLS